MQRHVPYGAYLRVKQGDQVERNQEICYWDPYNAVILTTIDGEVELQGLEEGITYREEQDEQTGYKKEGNHQV